MTEAEWDTCTDPDQMLANLRDSACQRKLRLLCCACCRRIWHLLKPNALQEAVAASERFADGEIDEDTVRAAASVTHPAVAYRDEYFSGELREEAAYAAYGVNRATNGRLVSRGQMVVATLHVEIEDVRKALEFFALAARAARDDHRPPLRRYPACVDTPLFTDNAEHARQAERAGQADLIREIFGHRSRTLSVASSWLGWNNGFIANLATAIYEEPALPSGKLDGSRLPILADALEDAGCTDIDLLGHLRNPCPHVRGCWALDALLGNC